MTEVDPRAELAPRDIVARAIFEEMEASGCEHVLLDMTSRDAGFLRRRFPQIYSTCLRYGVDLATVPAPVSPAAHSAMGGVATDLEGRTTVPGLYAAGEVACTGVHGANRLASNSLLEGLVFGARAGRAAVEDLLSRAPCGSRPILALNLASPASTELRGLAPATGGEPPSAEKIVAAICEVAWLHLGIVREASGLARTALEMKALGRHLSSHRPSTRALLEAENMAIVAEVIARSAIARQESRGSHYRSDYPETEDRVFGGSSYIAKGMPHAVISGNLAATGSDSQ